MPRRRLSKDQLARQRLLGAERARRYRERHAANVYALEATAAIAAVDAALVDALIAEHVRLRDATGDRDAALPLRGIVRLARERLMADGMAELDAHAAVRERLRTGALSLPGDPAPRLLAAA
ncbi:hypothetical protein MKK69_09255 [Methylobacterium sp. J-026]|jgi:hypothetical protein|uniref:hypothetical protein n=1 Tax=unclassified Methylobacterium TaxID=2615210 RepID=UPI0011C83F63|nr:MULTISPECIES: hypothetical protein [unclassified Methylobacterium]MCJ2134239.1 hypothetical protein [Methylobacterium sp. J-026]TXM71175.1 hypothetical protein FV229_00420 [Methylobacterium sp. WL120]